MGNRLELHEVLKTLLPEPHKKNLYFQPPENLKMSYPCIIYKWSRPKQYYANNDPYNRIKSYTVTVVDSDPESGIAEKVSQQRATSFERAYTSNNLNHFVFNLYF